MRPRLILFGASLVVAIGLAAAVVHRREPGITVETSAVTTGTITRQVLATATLEPSKAVEVGTQVSGTISSLPVDFNSVVSAAPGAVTYTAVVDVDNTAGRLTPGATAVVTITSGERRDVVRVPNQALAFTPSPALLERAGQKEPVLASLQPGDQLVTAAK